nr:MAG TPA: hypothetical protein [Crassvirales sp.]
MIYPNHDETRISPLSQGNRTNVLLRIIGSF